MDRSLVRLKFSLASPHALCLTFLSGIFVSGISVLGISVSGIACNIHDIEIHIELHMLQIRESPKLLGQN